MSEIKAIETRYKGYRFRSRLEARWAVFFDALRITWEYEPEGFVLSDGSRYLPDFFLPTFGGGMYVEVKPDGGDFSKASRFAEESKSNVWFAEGTPWTRCYTWAEWHDDIMGDGRGGCLLFDGIPNADQAWGEDRMYAQPGYEDSDRTIPKEYWGCLGNNYLNAVQAARSARFEHGERP